jgi:3-oxoacyl-[acyl-carrier protein] reductase
LAADGALIAVHYGRDEAAAKATVAAIESDGGRAFAVRAEFGTPGDIDTLFEGLARGLNGKPLDIVVNNAAIVSSDGGRIINVSSGVTWFAIPEVVYSMTKGALNVMSRSLALTQGRRGITVNNVSPGITATDMNAWLLENEESQKRVAAMTALGRHGQPADIADAVAFFASNDARWITGQTLEVNGGLFLGPQGDR